MKEYISKEDAILAICRRCLITCPPNKCSEFRDFAEDIAEVLSADVKPVVRGENIATEYAECDQFICSKCGIHLQDWNLIEDDYEDGVVHEFVFTFCPNCGADMRERSEEE